VPPGRYCPAGEVSSTVATALAGWIDSVGDALVGAVVGKFGVTSTVGETAWLARPDVPGFGVFAVVEGLCDSLFNEPLVVAVEAVA
jgi:hypothetical protein